MEGPSCLLWMHSRGRNSERDGDCVLVDGAQTDRGLCEGAQGLGKVTAAQNGVSKGGAPGRLQDTWSVWGLHILSWWPKQGGQPEDGNAESKTTNPLGALSSFVLPACSSVLASLINSMPIFLLSHSSFLVLTFLTCICWLRVGLSLCFSLWRKQADTQGDVEEQGKHQLNLDLGIRQ